MCVVAIDHGGFSTGICSRQGVDVIPSEKGLYMDRYLESVHGDHDYVMEVNGKAYMMGTLAVESKYPLEMHTASKANDFYDLSVLLAVWKYGYRENKIVVSVPITRHVDEEKEKIKSRLVGDWDVIVNYKKKSFSIDEVVVVPETVSGCWLEKTEGKIRWLDWGSRTIGFGTTVMDHNGLRFLNKESGTFEKEGMSALGVQEEELENLVDYVGGRLLAKWDEGDRVIHVGGGVYKEGLVEMMKKYFPLSEPVNDPQTYVVRGMYELGKEVFGDE